MRTLSPGLTYATGDAPRESTEVEIGTVDPLHRHGKRLGNYVILGRDSFEPF